ncbi:sugar transferase [Planctomycetota bacterium]|nr:sugar transferase [Planctomycetota bacterium]
MSEQQAIQSNTLDINKINLDINSEKRKATYLINFFMLLVMSPVLCLLFVSIMIAVKVEGKGPIFYRQIKTGRAGKKITLYQFRFMKSHADHLIEEFKQRYPQLSTEQNKYQPTYSRIGRWLERTGFCNLPQIYNILKGEMSLVGLQPAFQEQLQLGNELFYLYQKRRPGIMGLWQLIAYNDHHPSQRLHCDLVYMQKRSFIYDIKIILRTCTNVLRMKP